MNVMRLVTACLLFTTAAIAQEPTQDDFAAVSAMWRELDAGRYLAADAAVHGKAFGPDGKPKPGSIYDEWAQIQGLLTGEPAPPAPDGDAPAPAAADLAALAGATTRNAIDAIVERAKTTRLVILNEDHGSPRDRAFALMVARALRPLGYDVLGIETLHNAADDGEAAAMMAALTRNGHAGRNTGVYLRDPVFADFLRQSLALGYRPVAYEITDHNRTSDVEARIAQREQAQADQVVRRALDAHPASKVLLYVGFHHATERPQGESKRHWLATRLKRMTGIDPLTIDQTTFNAYGAGDLPLYERIADRAGTTPSVLMARGKPLVVGHYAGLVDLQVVHPRTTRIAGRPDWLAAMGRTLAPIPADLLPTQGTRLVQAFIASEGDDTIPIDQILVTAGKTPPALMLPSPGTGAVRYAVQDSTGP